MKLSCFISLFFIVAIGYTQNPTKQQIALLNELNKKFDYIQDDFFPENNRYVPKGIKIMGFDKTTVYPVIKRSGEVFFVGVFTAPDWIFVENVFIKIGDEVTQLPIVDECDRQTIYSGIKEVCIMEPIATYSIFEKIATSPETIIRYVGKSHYNQFKIDKDMWKDAYLFYQLLEKSGKFKK